MRDKENRRIELRERDNDAFLEFVGNFASREDINLNHCLTVAAARAELMMLFSSTGVYQYIDRGDGGNCIHYEAATSTVQIGSCDTDDENATGSGG